MGHMMEGLEYGSDDDLRDCFNRFLHQHYITAHLQGTIFSGHHAAHLYAIRLPVLGTQTCLADPGNLVSGPEPR